MIYAFLGRLNTTGTAICTMKNAGYPQEQTMKFTSLVLTVAHRLFYSMFDIIIAVSDILF